MHEKRNVYFREHSSDNFVVSNLILFTKEGLYYLAWDSLNSYFIGWYHMKPSHKQRLQILSGWITLTAVKSYMIILWGPKIVHKGWGFQVVSVCLEEHQKHFPVWKVHLPWLYPLKYSGCQVMRFSVLHLWKHCKTSSIFI